MTICSSQPNTLVKKLMDALLDVGAFHFFAMDSPAIKGKLDPKKVTKGFAPTNAVSLPNKDSR
jgi:hypothetical protein